MQRRSSWATFVFVTVALMLMTAALFAMEAEGKRRVRKSKRSKQQKKKTRNQIKAVKGPEKADKKMILKRILELADGPSNAYPHASENNIMPDDAYFWAAASNHERRDAFFNNAILRPFRVTRVAYSEEDKYARNLISDWMRTLGLEVETDAIGNVFGLWKGREVYKGEYTNIVLTGSHTDIVPEGGRWEGVSGILMILEAIRFMRAHGLRPRRSIEVVLFASTEPTRFGIPCIGSKAMTNSFSPSEIEILQTERDMNGNLFLDVLREAGFGKVPGIEDRNATLSEIISSVHARATKGPGYHRYSAFLEPHIEGMNNIQPKGQYFGYASTVAAYYNVKVTLTGKGGHASTTNTFDREGWDVTYAVADFLNMMERKAYNLAGELSVYQNENALVRITPYRIEFTPNAQGMIPHTATVWYSYHDMRNKAAKDYKEQVYRDIRKILPTGVSADVQILSSYDMHFIDETFREVQTHEFAFFRDHFEIPMNPLKPDSWYQANMPIYSIMDANTMHKIVPSGVFVTPNLKGFTKGAREHVLAKTISDSATALSLQLRHFSFYTDLQMRNNFNVTAAILADELMERQLGGEVTKIPLELRESINMFDNMQIREIEGDTPDLYDIEL